MKIYIFIIPLILCFQNGFSQKKPLYPKLVKSLNQYLTVYDNVSPDISDQFVIDSLDLAHIDLIHLKGKHNRNTLKTTNVIDVFDLIAYLQEDIQNITQAMLSHAYFKFYKFKDVIESNDFSIVESDDKKLYNFSLDEKTGGTYRSRTSWMHYTEMDSLQRIYNISDPYEKLDGDGYDRIYALDTKDGTKYILTSYVRSCSYCFETSVALVKLDKGEFKYDFNHSVNLRDWEGGVQYHPETKTITVDYITDDLTEHCNCEDIEVDEYEDSNTDQSEFQEKKCHCTFKFNGTNFELVKVLWEKL